MILNTNNYKEVCGVFYSRAKRWESNIPKNEPHAKEYVISHFNTDQVTFLFPVAGVLIILMNQASCTSQTSPREMFARYERLSVGFC